MRPDHEQSKQSAEAAGTQSGAGSAGGRGRTDAEKSARDVLGRVAEADGGAFGRSRGCEEDYVRKLERNRAERDALRQLVARVPEFVRHRDPSRHIARGNEHDVEQDSLDSSRVRKHTHSGFGFALEPTIAPFGGYLTLRAATPSEYIHRVDAMNHAFGDDTRIDGFTPEAGFVTSQRAIQGTRPLPTEIERFLRAGGYRRVSSTALQGHHISDKTWFHPKSGFVITDAKPDNFKKDAAGRITPIDLIMMHAPSGSDVFRILAHDGVF